MKYVLSFSDNTLLILISESTPFLIKIAEKNREYLLIITVISIALQINE